MVRGGSDWWWLVSPYFVQNTLIPLYSPLFPFHKPKYKMTDEQSWASINTCLMNITLPSGYFSSSVSGCRCHSGLQQHNQGHDLSAQWPWMSAGELFQTQNETSLFAFLLLLWPQLLCVFSYRVPFPCVLSLHFHCFSVYMSICPKWLLDPRCQGLGSILLSFPTSRISLEHGGHNYLLTLQRQIYLCDGSDRRNTRFFL